MQNEYLQFCPKLIEMLGYTEVTGRSGQVHKITELSGLSTVNNLVTLRNLFIEIKPKRTLEIGFAYGGSGLLFTASYREAGYQPSHQHTAIDPFQTAIFDEVGLIVIEASGLRDYLDMRIALSSLALPQLVAEAATFELIYIDGSHLFEDIFVDFYFATRLLTDGGIVLFDDCSDPHVQKILRFIRSNFGFAYEPVDLAPYREDKGATMKYKLAKIAGRNQLTAFRKKGPNERAWNAPFTNF